MFQEMVQQGANAKLEEKVYKDYTPALMQEFKVRFNDKKYITLMK